MRAQPVGVVIGAILTSPLFLMSWASFDSGHSGPGWVFLAIGLAIWAGIVEGGTQFDRDRDLRAIADTARASRRGR